MFTRKQYMDGECSYADYYGDVVEAAGITISQEIADQVETALAPTIGPSARLCLASWRKRSSRKGNAPTVHETKLLTYWRALNGGLLARGASSVDLDTARALMDAECSASEAVDLLWPPVRGETGGADAGLPRGWSRDFDEIFAEG